MTEETETSRRVTKYMRAIEEGAQNLPTNSDYWIESAAWAAVHVADQELFEQAKARATHMEGELVRKHHEAERLRAEVEVERGNADHAHEHAMEWRRRAEAAEAEVEEYRAKNFAPMSRINRAERVAEQAVADKQAIEATLTQFEARGEV